MKNNGVSKPADFRRARRLDNAKRAERLKLPSGCTMLAARPDPLEWILAGRIPQRLLAEVTRQQNDETKLPLTRDEVVEISKFAARLVEACIVDPPIGDGPDCMALEDIPVKDRVFIFQWACRSIEIQSSESSSHPAAEEGHSPALDNFRS